jgi:RNA polymerase subunit RPABC4/transcription elongation factor Spt4
MTFIRLDNGSVAHVRMAKRPARRCKVCTRLTNERWLRECDFVLPNGKTCDLLMCSNCAEATGPDTDLCPVHSIETKKVARDQSAAQ